MKIVLHLIGILTFLSVVAWGQTIPRPNIAAPQGLAVNSFTGNLFYQRNEQSLRGSYRIYQTFYYNAAQDTLNYGYGHGWSFYYNVFYKESADTVTIQRADGQKDIFLLRAGIYQSAAGLYDALVKNGSQFILTSKNGEKHFFADATHKKLTRIQDTNGNFINIDYANGYPVKASNSSGRSLLLIWENGLLKEASDESEPQKKYTYIYNSNKDMIAVTNPMQGRKSFSYNNHYLVRLGDENNNPVVVYYYGNGGKVKQIVSCDSEQRFSFLATQRKTFVTQKANAENLVTGYSFDEQGRLTGLTDPEGNHAEYTYNANNNLLSQKDFKGLISQFSYDSNGNILRETNALGNAIEYSYETNFQKPLTIKDQKGNITILSYDTNGNLISFTKPGGITESYTYDAFGRRISAKNANANSTTYEYNTNGDLVKIQYPVGAVLYEYNGNCCKVSKITDANGSTLEMTYDLLNRTKTIKDGLGNTVGYEYDAVGNIIKETDPNGNAKKYGYDGLNRLTSVTMSAETWNYDYDGQNNLIKMTDANGNVTSYNYNKRNQLEKETDPLGHSVGYTYDINGNRIERNDPTGNTVNYQYDDLGRLIEKSYLGNTDNYGYDEAGNLISAFNNNIAYSFEYDNLNRLFKKNILTWGKSLTYTYDAVGNRKTMTDHDGGVTTYHYDVNNRLNSLSNPANRTTSFEYDSGGRIQKQINGNGTFTSYSYDLGGRLDSLINWKNSTEKISFFYYTFDKYGNRKTMQDKRGLHTYTYDQAHRLTNVAYADGNTENFTLDATGNRTKRMKNGVETAYQYNAADQIKTAGLASFAFDANGNTTQQSDGQTRSLHYDGENRLLGIQLNSKKKVQYKYDPFGDKIEKLDTLSVVTKMMYDGDNLLGELNNSNSTLISYTTAFGMDSWLSYYKDNQTYTYHKDGINSTVEMSSNDLDVVNEYSYDVYGNITSRLGSENNKILYTGRPYESDIKYYDYRTRFYDASTGRFTAKDILSGSLNDQTSINRYNYVGNDPINFNDPVGLSPVLAAIRIGNGVYRLGIAIGIVTGTIADNFSRTDEHTNRNCANKTPTMAPDQNGQLDGWNRVGQMGSVYHQPDRGNKAGFWDSVFDDFRYIKYTKRTGSGAMWDGSSEAIWDSKQKRYLVTGEPGGPSYNYYDPSSMLYTGLIPHYFKDMLPHEYNPNYTENCPPNPEEGSKDPLPQNPEEDPTKVPIIAPSDPNEIMGPAGYDTLKWVALKQNLAYKVLFENDPDFATAPAQNVTVYVPIHEKLNPASVRISDFGFGSFNFSVPANTSIYNNRLDVRDSLGVYVDVTAGLDIANRRAFWIFQSIDPATGLAATLPADSGFLPVNDSTRNNGEGYITFTIIPSSFAQTRDTISAQASIIFDSEETIRTNKWINTIDAVAPVSSIGALPAVVDSVFNISWAGQDDATGSGLKDFILYVSKNNGPFTLYKDKLTVTTEELSGQKGNRLSFYTRAADNAGNLETNKSAGDRIVTINVPGTSNITCIGNSIYLENPAVSGAAYQWQVDIGTGFAAISNNGVYDGTNTVKLLIKEIPSSFYGYKYRVRITNGGATTYGTERKLSFASTWLGIAGESWNNPANWSCGLVPDGTTDVIIPKDVPANPVVTTLATCYSLTMNKQSAITIKNGVKLEIKGN